MTGVDLFTVQKLADGLASVNGSLWTRAQARKVWSCNACGSTVAKGGLVWRPLTERGGIMRNNRVCDDCIEGEALGSEVPA